MQLLTTDSVGTLDHLDLGSARTSCEASTAPTVLEPSDCYTLNSGGGMIKLLKGKEDSFLSCKKKSLTTFLNPYSYLVMRKHVQVLECFDRICFDGFLLAWLMRLTGSRVERVSFDMTSLAPEVFRSACNSGESVFFIGSEPGVARDAMDKIVNKYPEMLVCGVRHGFFSNVNERHDFVKELAELDPDVVVVGMGAPLQERFLVDLKAAGWKGVGYTCGGFLHQTARKGVGYYPKWMDRLHLRWLYRMIDEPKLIRRYFVDYPKFLFVFFYDLVSYHLSERRKRRGLKG
jgi:exopolysaccharide biosynthesis WecB/TagA/CpsF family protein